nr:retrovirus-related Pol polyprotein from transposon TNT 1-94 [Tanacetum cinerariifolium]
MAAVEVPQTLEYRGGQLNAALILEVENFTNWKKRFMCHIIGIEPQFENIIKNGPFVPMTAGQRKPKNQWSGDEIKAANLDQRLKSLIMSDFQDSPGDEEDTRSSHEYLNDLKEEYQARSLLAKSKRFFKKVVEENDAFSKEGAKNGEWVKISMRKCISEQIPSQKKRILGVDQLIKDPSSLGLKDLVFVKSSADDTKVTIPGVERPWLSEAEGFILPNHDTDESSVYSIPLPPLKKLDAPTKGNKSSSASKVHSAPAVQIIPQLITMTLNGSKEVKHQAKKDEALKSTPFCSAEWFERGPKVVFGDDSTCTTEGYGSIKCIGIVFTKFNEKRETIFNSNKEIVMIAPRVRDVYVLDMTSSTQESCFFAKASENLNWLWHKRLAHLNFKTINKMAKQNLVIGLPSLVYSKDKPCSKKSPAPETIMSFIKRIENQNDIKVKQLRTDNGTEFKNSTLVNFYDEKGISQNLSSPYTPEQNGVAERKNRTLIEATRTMLSGYVFSKQYWIESVATACYTQNKYPIVKRHLKTPYEIFCKRIPNINFLHVFRCPLYIHNHKDHLRKFDEKADDGYLLGYSLVSKAFRVFNTKIQQTKETYHITFDESPEAIKFSKPSVTLLNQKDIHLMNLFILMNLLKVKTSMVPPNNLGPDLNGKSVNETQYRGFDLKGYSDSDYAGFNMDRKITLAEAEYVTAAGCCANILWMKS